MATYEHRDNNDQWHAFSAADNERIDAAHRAQQERITLMQPQNPAGLREFEMRFGDAAVSRRLPTPPSTEIIQVNTASGATRIVRRMSARRAFPRGAHSFAMHRATSFGDDPALYGWLLRRLTSGWRRGAWQRRFFVLVPQKSCLLYFHRGLHTREVQLCRNADASAPAARGIIPLANAMVCTDNIDRAKPHSFSIAVPGSFEYDLAAHSKEKKEAWLDQLVRVARGDDLQPSQPDVATRPVGGVVRTTTGATLPLGAASGVAPLPSVRTPPANPFSAAPPNPFTAAAPPEAAPAAPPPPPPNPFLAPPNPFSSSNAPQVDQSATSDPFGDHVLAPTVRRTESAASSEPADLVEAFAACVMDEEAQDHCECAVCFDELYKRTQGVLLDDAGRRLCKHVVHLNCLKDLPSYNDNHGAPLCPLCRRESAGVTELPSIFEDARRWFDLVDLDRNGQVAAEDVLATLKAQLPVDEEAIDAQWDSLWAHFDHNSSGTLAYDDVAAPERGLVAFLERAGLNKVIPKSPRAPPPKLESDPGAWFDYWDEDGVGALEEGEVLRALVHSLDLRGDRGQVRGTADLVRACLAACDIDSRVTREDFVRENGLATVVAENLGLRSFRTEPPRPAEPTNFDISIRTNGGRNFAASDFPAGSLTEDTTVELLRSMIAQVSDSRPESIRLVNRGVVLRNDSQTLRAAGVRPGDHLGLIIMAGASRHGTRPPAYSSPAPAPAVQVRRPSTPAARPPAYSLPPVPAPRRRTSVRVPNNAGPGSIMTVRAPTGETVRVTVPAGMHSGSSFEFEYGGQPASGPPRLPPRPASYAAPPRPTGGGQLMRVQVPRGSGPGASLTVNVPGRGAHRVTVPPNVHAGMHFQFRVN